MNRRRFISTAISAAVAGSLPARPPLLAEQANTALAGSAAPSTQPSPTHHLDRHRFGVNYTPTKDWWFCWNNWDAGSIQRDLDGIASLGADHLRLLLIWPYFQPNPTWVSPLHLQRLDEMLTLMAARNLDAVITVFTGQLSGWFFLPPFNRPDPAFYTDPAMWSAQELMIHRLGQVMNSHQNIIGFDIGNEIDTCWRAPLPAGDAWMAKMLALMYAVAPTGLHVNGVDEEPWFQPDTFSPRALAALPMPTMHCYPYWSGALKYGGPMDPPSTKLLAANAILIRSYAADPRKPVWAEEFNTCIESLTQKQQAEWLETAVLAAIEAGVSWFTYWDSYDVNHKFQFNSLEYSLGLLTNDRKIKEQGRVFRHLAAGYRGKSVKFPSQPLPPPPVHPSHESTWQWMMNWMGWTPPKTADKIAGQS